MRFCREDNFWQGRRPCGKMVLCVRWCAGVQDGKALSKFLTSASPSIIPLSFSIAPAPSGAPLPAGFGAGILLQLSATGESPRPGCSLSPLRAAICVLTIVCAIRALTSCRAYFLGEFELTPADKWSSRCEVQEQV